MSGNNNRPMTGIDKHLPRKVNKMARVLQEREHFLNDVKTNAKEVQRSTRRVTNVSNPWKKMSTVGMALIVCPDPFSTIAGIPLFAVGQLVNRRSSGTRLRDVSREVRKLCHDLNEIRI